MWYATVRDVWALTVWAPGRLGAGTFGRRRLSAGRFGAVLL